MMLFFLLPQLIQAQSSIISQSAIGCLRYTGPTCTQLCDLGVRDCSSLTPLCEYGYFLFKQSCVQCPYQSIVDLLNLYCMDCVEDPYNWNTKRKCTYGYTVGNRNATYGAYIKNNYDYFELYFVGSSTTTYTWSGAITRNTSIPYQVYICSGCQDFCNLTSEGCNEISNDYQSVDTDKYGIKCLGGFYFKNGLCQTCTVLNCQTCLNNICSQCNTGYYYQNNVCNSCPSNCLTCLLISSKIVCLSCDQSKTDAIYIPSLSQNTCDQCGSQCMRCEYVSYVSGINIQYPTRTGAEIDSSLYGSYIKRCRQCISDSFTLSYDGINCDPCTIKYCSRCYYSSGTTSTLDLDYTPWSSVPEPTLKCYYCNSGYTLSSDKLTCSTNTATISNCLYHYMNGAILSCFQCSSSYVLYNNQCQSTCSQQIANCLYCFAYSSPDSATIVVNGVVKTQNAQLLYQCIKCDSGYYPDFFTGLCVLCNNYCNNCWQYSQSYNFTDYLITQNVLSDSSKSFYTTGILLGPYCSSCDSGYTQYGNACKGCSYDCVVESSSGTGLSQTTSSCSFKGSDAFCGMCYNYYRDRSLKSDQTECHECPKNCQACRQRTQEEINAINPYFNPISTKLQKYSYLCYKYQSSLDPSSNQVVDYDTQINMPITCSSIGPSGQTSYCSYTQTIQVQLYCDDNEYTTAYTSATSLQQPYIYKLSNYFQTTSDKVAIINFPALDAYTLYSSMNQQVVKQIFFVVQLFKNPVNGVRSCQFDKSVKFVAAFQQNVFSLTSFIYILEGSQNNTLLQLEIQGTLEFPSISGVQVKGINLNYYSGGAGYQNYFGFVLTPSIVGNLVLNNFEAGRNYEKGWSNAPFYLTFTNSQELQLNNARFYNLSATVGDLISFGYSLQRITIQTFTLNNFEFNNCTFSSQVLFQFNLITVGSTFFNVDGLKFYQCKFSQTTLFGEPIGNQKLTALMKLKNVNIHFCEFIDSYMINLKSLKNLQITNFDIIRSSFNNSILIKSNHFNLTNFYFDQNLLYTNSFFFYSVLQVIQDDSIYPSLSIYYFNNATIKGTYCLTINCIMDIKTPNNNAGILASFQINNVSLLETDALDMVASSQESMQLISIQDFNTTYINTFISDNNRGVRIIKIVQVYFVSVKNSLYDWSDNDMFPNGTFMSQNKRIPITQSCAIIKTNRKLYSDIFLYIAQYKYGVELDTITVRQQLSIDTSFIVIVSWDILQQNTTGSNIMYPGQSTEVLVLNNLFFITNSLVITSVFTQISSLYITSEQNQIIFMNNCQFINNHLHKLVENSVRTFSTTIYLNIPLTTISISNCVFKKNRATKSSFGIAIIIAESTTIKETTFQDTNIIDMEWYSRLETPYFFIDDQSNTINNTLAMKSFFQILSLFGNLQLTSQLINIEQSQFLNGYAQSGSGLYIIATEQAQINITNSIFNQQLTSLSSSSNGIGGCMYIDASGAALAMTLNQVSMKNCIAYTSSGCIYIETSNFIRDIYIKKSNFENCQALDNQFMGISFSSTKAIQSTVYIINSSFFNNSVDNYLMNLEQFAITSLESIFTSQLNYYQQTQGKLVISDCQFIYLRTVTILQLNNLQGLVLENTQISQNTIFLKPLIQFSFNTAISVVVIKNTKLSNNYNQSIFDSHTIDTLNVISCNSYFQTYTQYTIDTQNCTIMTPIRLNFTEKRIAIYTNVVLYNQQYYLTYTSLASDMKYDIPYINYQQIIYLPFITIKNQLQFILFDTFNTSYQLSMQQCIYSLMYKRLGIQSTISIMYFSSFLTNSLLTVNSLLIEHNICYFCTSGLFAITLIQSTKQSIGIIDTTCYNNTIGYYGCITLTQNQIFTNAIVQFPITDLPVFNTSAEVVKKRLLQTNDIEIAMLKNPNNVFYIFSCKFIENRAKVGSGIFVQGVATTLMNSLFADNIASLMGGGIFFDSLGDSKQIQLFDIQFQGNLAQVGAGIFISSSTFPSPNSNQNLLDIHFSNNNASVSANNLEEQPRRLTILMNSDKILPTQIYNNYTGYQNQYGLIDTSTSPIIDIISLQNYSIPNYPNKTNFIILPSGQAINTYKYYYSYTNEQVGYDWKFRIINLDRYNQTMSNLQSSEYCKVSGRVMDSDNYDDNKSFTNNFTDKSSYYFNTSIGAYDLDSMILTFDPYLPNNIFLQLKFVCSSMKIPVFNTTPPFSRTDQSNSNYQLLANIRTFPCQLGEAYKQKQCQACSISEQTYAVKLKQTQCNSIDQTQMESVKPTAIHLRAGYYRPYFDSSKISYCTNLVANCNGGWDPGDPSCYTGHTGALCESCDIYNKRGAGAYSLSSSYQCGPCSGTTEINSLIIVGMSFFTLISICLSVKGSYKMLEDFAHQKRLASIGVLISNESSNLSILIKLFTNYFQIISALTTFQLSFPSSLTSTVQVVGNPTKSMSYSLDCFLVDLSDIDILYFRMIWALLMPVLYLAVFFFGYFLGVITKWLPYKEGIIYTTFIYMFIYLQPTLVGGFISLASSRDVSGYSWVQADVEYRSDSDTHYIWLFTFVMPLLIVWAMLFPSLFFIFVRRIKDDLDDLHNRMKLGYFYNEYNEDGYLWEFVKIFSKEMIIIFLTFYEDQVVIKGLIVFLIIFFYGGFTVLFTPYTSKRLNFIDRLSTAICAGSICLGVLIYASSQAELEYLVYIMFAIIAVLNSGFILLMLFYLFQGYLQKFEELFDKARDYIRIYHPEVSERYPWMKKMLINKTKMKNRVKSLWSKLREKVKQGIKRRRLNSNAPLFINEIDFIPQLKPYDYQDGDALLITVGNNSPGRSAKVYPINNIQDSPLEL